MRAMVISGTWGKNAAQATENEIEQAVSKIPERTHINVFNGGTVKRLAAIMNLANEYDFVIWNPKFNGDSHLDPRNYIGETTCIMA